MIQINESEFDKLNKNSIGFVSEHFNVYYNAVLLLAYKLNGHREYLDVAINGLTAIMNVFPNTIREHSETQELCCLILPLACLYDVTRSEEHLIGYIAYLIYWKSIKMELT